jgi:hypothetical protein
MKAALLIIACAPALLAQQSSGPPAVLQIIQEDIKEGKGAAHERSEATFMQVAARSNFPTHVLGLTSITGTSQAWFLEAYDNFASIAEARAAMNKPELAGLDAADAELRTGSRSLIAAYRQDLSYAPEKIDLPKARYFMIETLRVRAGEEMAFIEMAKLLKGAAEKSNDNQPVVTYEVVSGGPEDTFLLMMPAASLKSMDEDRERNQALFAAMGAEGVKRYSKAASESLSYAEILLFSMNPKMSYPPKEWIAEDPEFWGQKPQSKPAPK